jgi:hypothetical protein
MDCVVGRVRGAPQNLRKFRGANNCTCRDAFAFSSFLKTPHSLCFLLPVSRSLDRFQWAYRYQAVCPKGDSAGRPQ